MTQQPASRTKKDGTKLVEPSHELEEKIGPSVDIAKIISPEKVAAAEGAIEESKGSFGPEAMEDIARLKQLYATAREELEAGTPKEKSAAFRELQDIVLNLKSAGGMYDYPLATEVAKRFFRYTTDHDCLHPRDPDIVAVFIRALETVFSLNIHDNGGEKGKLILKELDVLLDG